VRTIVAATVGIAALLRRKSTIVLVSGDPAPSVTALTASSLSATTPTPKRTPAPLTDASTRGYREPKFLDLDKIPF